MPKSINHAFFEPLEPRQLMSSLPFTIHGTEAADFIDVTAAVNPLSGHRLTIRINNGVPQIRPLARGQGVLINGMGGNDTIRFTGSLGVLLNGGLGNDVLIGGAGNDTLFGDAGADMLDGGLGADQLNGGADSDSANYSARTVPLRLTLDNAANDGQFGEHDNIRDDIEVLFGGTSNDYLSTGSSYIRRQLFGSGGNDTLEGDGSLARQTLSGDSGDDLIRGGPGSDLMYGGAGRDSIYGGGSGDSIYGGGGNDNLYGGSGNDILFGQEGNDGLFGGAGADILQGYSGADRFLIQRGDGIQDLTTLDARINFRDGQQVTKNFSGQDGSYTFAPRNWTDSEIEAVDEALDALHTATGNTRLLKRSNRSELTFIRQGDLISSTGGTFSAAAWNSSGQIHVVSPSTGTIIHEIGHNWDTEFNAAGWNALSGWTHSDMSGNSSYQPGTGNDGWWHLRTAQFVSSYARTNPREDFAESIEAYILNPAGRTSYLAKASFIDDMLNTLAADA